jgi:hypothetical protein
MVCNAHPTRLATYIAFPYNTLIPSVRPYKTPTPKFRKASKTKDMGEQPLDGSDVMPILQQMCRQKMFEGTTTLVCDHSCLAGGLLNSPVLGAPDIRFSHSHSRNPRMVGRASQAARRAKE